MSIDQKNDPFIKLLTHSLLQGISTNTHYIQAIHFSQKTKQKKGFWRKKPNDHEFAFFGFYFPSMDTQCNQTMNTQVQKITIVWTGSPSRWNFLVVPHPYMVSFCVC